MQRFFGKGTEEPLEALGPHVQLEDVAWRQAEEVIYRLEPALKFWEGLDYVGVMHDGRPVSLNLQDNAISYCNGLDYGHQTARHMQTSLRDELQVRYMRQEKLQQDIMKQLDQELLEPRLLGLGA